MEPAAGLETTGGPERSSCCSELSRSSAVGINSESSTSPSFKRLLRCLKDAGEIPDLLF